MTGAAVIAFAPGRVNLMGDHTDYTGGLALPMAIDLGTTVTGVRGGDAVELRSDWSDEPARIPLGGVPRTVPDTVRDGWSRYVAGVVAELGPPAGFTGAVTSTLPIGAGLSSSASLQIALVLALGFDGAPVELAALAQRAEHRATGVPCGIMDQMAVTLARPGHALWLDCHDRSTEDVPLPEDLEVVVVHSGQGRTLADSGYSDRVAACRLAEAEMGPLRTASVGDLSAISDPIVARRARHVVTENARVRDFATALATGDRPALAEIMAASHRSLRDDYEVSTPAVEGLVDTLVATPGVVGARLTGAGFGGCVVALVEPATQLPSAWPSWRVRSAGPARTVSNCG